MKNLICIILFIGAMVNVQAQERDETIYNGINFHASAQVNISHRNQIKYTLSQSEVRQAIEESGSEISDIVVVPENHELGNSIIGTTLLVTPNASPLLIEDILYGVSKFRSAEYILETYYHQIKGLTDQLLLGLSTVETKSEIFDLLSNYYDVIPRISNKVSPSEFRERLTLVLADQNLEEVRERAIGLSESGGALRSFAISPFLIIIDIILFPVRLVEMILGV